MKDLSRVEKNEKGYYVERVRKTAKGKDYICKNYGELRICPICNENFFAYNHQIKKGLGNFCSRSHARFKTGRVKRIDGRIIIWKPEHPYCNGDGYLFEHRLVMEQTIGRYLHPYEVVHHINRVVDDNRPENLKLFKTDSLHKKKDHNGEVENFNRWKRTHDRLKKMYPYMYEEEKANAEQIQDKEKN